MKSLKIFYASTYPLLYKFFVLIEQSNDLDRGLTKRMKSDTGRGGRILGDVSLRLVRFYVYTTAMRN